MCVSARACAWDDAQRLVCCACKAQHGSPYNIYTSIYICNSAPGSEHRPLALDLRKVQRRPRRPPGALPVQLRRRLRRHVHRPGPARLLHPRRCRTFPGYAPLRQSYKVISYQPTTARPSRLLHLPRCRGVLRARLRSHTKRSGHPETETARFWYRSRHRVRGLRHTKGPARWQPQPQDAATPRDPPRGSRSRRMLSAQRQPPQASGALGSCSACCTLQPRSASLPSPSPLHPSPPVLGP